MLTNSLTRRDNGWLCAGSILKSTGMAVGTIISLFSPISEANIGTAGSRYIELNVISHSNNLNLKVNNSSTYATRTSQENLSRIRAVLKCNVSDIASVFGVSRQAIYNWASGEEPIPTHAKKLHDLALAADLFAAEGITLNGHILKRKISDGKTLFEITNSGESAKEAAQTLIRVLNRESEQRKVLNSRLANRANSPINPAEIGIPAYNEKS
jgi:DNA-binding transcriptional regulator YiaG